MTAAELDLDAIEARADAASSGPWWVANLRTPTGPDLWHVAINRTIDTPDGPRDEPVCAVEYETCGFQYPHHDAQSDAAFIANARRDVPALVAEVRRLRAEREHMELHPTGTVEWLKNRVAELTAERDQLTAYNRAVKGANDDLRAELAKVRRGGAG